MPQFLENVEGVVLRSMRATELLSTDMGRSKREYEIQMQRMKDRLESIKSQELLLTTDPQLARWLGQNSTASVQHPLTFLAELLGDRETPE